MKREAKRIRRELTPEEREKVQGSRQWAHSHEAEIQELAKLYRDAPCNKPSTLKDVLTLLKAERLRQQLSLADVHNRSGIERPNLSRLENEVAANPTIATVMRYAEALGKQLFVVLADLPAGK